MSRQSSYVILGVFRWNKLVLFLSDTPSASPPPRNHLRQQVASAAWLWHLWIMAPSNTQAYKDRAVNWLYDVSVLLWLTGDATLTNAYTYAALHACCLIRYVVVCLFFFFGCWTCIQKAAAALSLSISIFFYFILPLRYILEADVALFYSPHLFDNCSD